jgi:hypothetical protein
LNSAALVVRIIGMSHRLSDLTDFWQKYFIFPKDILEKLSMSGHSF